MRRGWTAVNKDERVSLMDTTRPKPVAPRQLRAVETRRKLLAAVEEIVATEGPDAVTTTRLAQALGVAVGTIYRYFDDREALLLAAYDSTVERIVADCARVLERLPRDLSTAQAGGVLLAAYLSAAEAVPAHVGLLKAMRAIRPIEADQKGDAQQGILYDLFMPFLARYLPDVTSVAPVPHRHDRHDGGPLPDGRSGGPPGAAARDRGAYRPAGDAHRRAGALRRRSATCEALNRLRSKGAKVCYSASREARCRMNERVPSKISTAYSSSYILSGCIA
jgi:AcrR family transcriptional regulator